MANETRTIKICSRCDTKLDREFKIKDYLPIITDGWHSVKGNLLCPQCYAHGEILFNKYMRKEI